MTEEYSEGTSRQRARLKDKRIKHNKHVPGTGITLISLSLKGDVQSLKTD